MISLYEFLVNTHIARTTIEPLEDKYKEHIHNNCFSGKEMYKQLDGTKFLWFAVWEYVYYNPNCNKEDILSNLKNYSEQGIKYIIDILKDDNKLARDDSDGTYTVIEPEHWF